MLLAISLKYPVNLFGWDGSSVFEVGHSLVLKVQVKPLSQEQDPLFFTATEEEFLCVSQIILKICV